MTQANLPPSRVTFGIGKTLSAAWRNGLNSWSRISSRTGGATHNPYDVHDLLEQQHSKLHEQMTNQALTRLYTGRTIQPAALAPDVHGVAVNEMGMTNVGQHVAPIPTSADRSSPMSNALATNLFDTDKGSLMYSIPAGSSIHDAVPYQPSF